MKRCLALLVCWSLVAHAGMHKQESTPYVQITSNTKQAFDKDGNVDLNTVIDLKVNDTVTFQVDGNVVVGVVTQRNTVPETSLQIVGDFSKTNKAGFVFQFTSSNTVLGILIFTQKNFIYKLSFDGEKQVFCWIKQEIKPPDIVPPTGAMITK